MKKLRSLLIALILTLGLGMFLLPVFADEMLRAGELSIRVIPTDSQWFGVTYPEDRSRVVEELKKLHEDGIYPY